MYFNYIRALADLQCRQKREREMLLQAGISEQDIHDLFRLERRQLDSDTRFYLSLDAYITPLDVLPVQMDSQLGVMDEIESPQLHRALLALTDEERELVLLHVVDGLPLKLLAALRGKPYDTIKKSYGRAIGRLKNYF